MSPLISGHLRLRRCDAFTPEAVRTQGYFDYRDMLRAMDLSSTHASKMLRFFEEDLYRQQ